MTDLRELDKKTRDIYVRNAAAFDVQRHKGLHERKWLDHFASQVPEGGRILDVGCGAAEPIARYFIERGFILSGIDFSETMLALARARFPDNTWRLADMRHFELNETFHGLIAWNSFFHLNPDDQRKTLEVLARHLAPGGILMLTVGPEAGEVIGHVNGEQVYHSSLAFDEYERVLGELGLQVTEFVAEDEECDQQTVLISKKIA